MENEFLISQLSYNQDPIFVNYVFNKNVEQLTNLGKYIKTKNLVFLPFEKQDLEICVLDAIKSLKNIYPDAIKKFSYQTILRRVFVQQLISLNRKFLTNKEKILSIATSNVEGIERFVPDTYLEQDYSLNYDLSKLYTSIMENIKKNDEKEVFKLYLQNVRPADIAKKLNIPIKKIYNYLFNIKAQCTKYKKN